MTKIFFLFFTWKFYKILLGFCRIPWQTQAMFYLSSSTLQFYCTVQPISLQLFRFNNIHFFCGAAAQRGPWPPHSWGFYITHSDATQSVGLLWTRDQCVAESSNWQNTTFVTDRYRCPRWDSNPQSQQTSSRRPAP